MKKILFLCTHNACRSIIAEAVANRRGGDRLQAQSAGAAPSGEVHPDTLLYLPAAGYSIDQLRSKAMDELEAFAPDVVITVCDSARNEACPLWLGKTEKVHWGLADPSHGGAVGEAREQAFLELIAILEKRIDKLMSCDFDGMSNTQFASLLERIGGDA